ncbi:MAG: homogentisate phytyltransferase [Cyanobacteria bacterium P01_A01_bin.114]
MQNPTAWLQAFWRFSRPHTIIGTSLSVIGLFAISWATRHPLGDTPTTLQIWRAITAMLLTWLACLCGNVYIVGLNQIEDVEIDRINKPHLPIASGEFSRSQALLLVVLAAFCALGLAVLSRSLYLITTIWISLAIGTTYSLPPIRLKRFPFWASFCILTVRGVVVNLGVFLHATSQLDLRPIIPARVWALTLFVLVFSFAIAIFKDIPDIEGDRRYNITTFTLQLGQKAVFNLARWVLTLGYGGLILSAPFLPNINPWLLIGTHGLILSYFWYLSRRVGLSPLKAQTVDLSESTPASTSASPISYPTFYQFIWKLFFIEYLIFPITCWLV